MTTESPTVENEVVTTTPVVGNESTQAQAGQNQDAQSGATGSESSAEKDSGAKGPSTALEAAKAALGLPGTAAESPPASEEGSKTPVKAGAEDDKSSAIDKAIADTTLPFHKHPRWKEVTTAAKALETEVGELTPKAQKWDALDAKFQETGLAPQDVGPLFDGGAMLKRAGVLPQEVTDLMKVGAALKLGDREVVRQLAAPVFEAMGLTLVEVLPKDIQDRIEQGALSEDDGRRLANVEFKARQEQALRERAERRIQERDNADNAGALERRIEAASSAWEARVRKTDADWASKEEHIVKAIQELVRQREPQNEKEVVDICQRAYDQVSRIMRTAAPRRAAPVTPTRSGSTTTTAPVPRSSLEAAKIGLTRGQ
jgi:hypothetical protein